MSYPFNNPKDKEAHKKRFYSRLQLYRNHFRTFAYSNSKRGKGVNQMSDPLTTLRTKTPEEGFQLAVTLAQKGVEITQPSEAIRKKLRPKYSRNANSLIAASEVIAIHFQTVAKANNYWQSSKYNINIKK